MRRISSLCLLATLLGGCASWFMNGGKLADRDYAAPVRASYTIGTCQMNDGSTTPGPHDTIFQVVQEPTQLALFERGADGTGAVITNTWADAAGDHYFGWVQKQGWEYIIPRDPLALAERRVYVNLEVVQNGGVSKPITPPAGRCPLTPVQTAGAATPGAYAPPAAYYPQPQPQPGAYPQPYPQQQPQPQPGAYPQPYPQQQPYPQPQPGTYPQPYPQQQPYPQPQPGTYPQPYPQPQPGTHPQQQQPYPQPQPSAYPQPQS